MDIAHADAGRCSGMGLTDVRVAQLLWHPLRRLLAGTRLNPIVLALVRPFASRLSSRVLLFVPVARSVWVKSPVSGHAIVLENPEGRDPIASLLYWRGLAGWEPETTSVFLRLLESDSILLDVGANTGLFSLLAAEVDPSIEVHAFEPVPSVFEVLERNLSRNAFRNVTAHELALVDRGSTVTLYIPKGRVPVMASIQPGWTSSSTEATTVKASTIDEFLRAREPCKVSMIKIDVEGAENQVLRGAAKTIARHRPLIICEVLTTAAEHEATFELMQSAGYACLHLSADGPRPTSEPLADHSDCKNYLFIPVDRLAAVTAILGVARSAPPEPVILEAEDR
jgi:FkbM family methyltransferase